MIVIRLQVQYFQRLKYIICTIFPTIKMCNRPINIMKKKQFNEIKCSYQFLSRSGIYYTEHVDRESAVVWSNILLFCAPVVPILLNHLWRMALPLKYHLVTSWPAVCYFIEMHRRGMECFLADTMRKYLVYCFIFYCLCWAHLKCWMCWTIY